MSAVLKPSRAKASAKSPKSAVESANAAAASFAALTAKLDYLPAEDVESIRRAYRFADEAHLGQMRGNGEPYITHPISVASLCAEWRLDAQALMAALMHDTLEDCGISKPEIIEKFGSSVAEWPHEARKTRIQHPRRKPSGELPQNATSHGARCARHPHQARRSQPQHAHDG
jgi:GTP diphosphokinase / guanosine-3',5'-bis(diphosphate) 3'-diphosphatase